jgi:hypothetical protein
VPLFLSVALGLSAMETGVRLLPLSLTLLLFAAGSRSCCRTPTRGASSTPASCCSSPAGLLVSLLDIGAGPEIITGPLLLIGSGSARWPRSWAA